uniref:Uncharacterized protein n=1 Tax=Pseudomonas putida TaxID=303 RepID=B1N7I6_PSEPU|nr:hypothetical protein [Pseudomonas putida]
MPAGGGQALGAGHGAGVPGLVGQVLAKVAALVGHQHHVVFGGLGEQRHVGLGAAALVVVEGPGLLRYQLHAKALHRTAQGGGIGMVVFGLAHHQQRPLPLAQHQKLHQRIGQHGPPRQAVQHIAQALAAAQAVVGAAGVEQQAVGQRGRQSAQAGGRGIHHKQPQALVVLCLCRLQQRLGAVDRGVAQLELLLQEAPGAVTVDNRQLGTLPPGVGGLRNDIGQQRAGVRPIAQVADAHLQWCCGLALSGGRQWRRQRRGQGQQAGQGKVGRLAHNTLHGRWRQHRKPAGRRKYAESSASPVPR